MTAVETTNGKTAEAELAAPRRLSLGCGEAKPEGFFGVDISPDAPGVDLVCNLWPDPWVPWPIKTDSVREVECSHLVEHIPHWRPGWEQDGFWLFFQEVWRVCRKDAVVKIVHPYVMSGRAFWDPTHERYIHDVTWGYLNREWRQAQNLDHFPYPTGISFDVVTIDGNMHSEEFLTRPDAQQMFARDHYWNVVADLQVTLKVVK